MKSKIGSHDCESDKDLANTDLPTTSQKKNRQNKSHVQ